MLVYAPGLIVELLTFLMLFGRVWLLIVGLGSHRDARAR